MRLSEVRTWAGIVVISSLCSIAAAAPADAQTPGLNVSGGYQFTNAQRQNLNGWYADISVPFTKLLSVVGDASGSYFSESASTPGFSASVSLKLHTAMGGVRVARTFKSILVPFGQALAGAAATTASAQISGGLFEDFFGEPIDVSGTSTNFAIQLGGGVDIMVHPKVGVRIGAGYVRIFANSTGLNAFRIGVGAVLPLGSK